jgi:hypothetical protein
MPVFEIKVLHDKLDKYFMSGAPFQRFYDDEV